MAHIPANKKFWIALSNDPVFNNTTKTIVTSATTFSQTTTNAAPVASTSLKSFLPLALNFNAVGSNSSGAYE